MPLFALSALYMPVLVLVGSQVARGSVLAKQHPESDFTEPRSAIKECNQCLRVLRYGAIV